MKHSKDRASGSLAGALAESAFLHQYLIQKLHFQLDGCFCGEAVTQGHRHHSRSRTQHKLPDQQGSRRGRRAKALRTLFDDGTDGTVRAGTLMAGMLRETENRAEYGQAKQYGHQNRSESGFHIQHLLSARTANTEMIINIILRNVL